MEVLRRDRGTWVRPRNLTRAEIDAGEFVGGGGRRYKLYEEHKRRLLTDETVKVEDEVVRLDPSHGS